MTTERTGYRSCLHCGSTFPPATNRRYCGKSCSRQAEIERLEARKVFPDVRRTCAICGKEFKPVKGNHVHCSADCRQRHRNLSQATERRRVLATTIRQCVHCGVSFTPRRAKSQIACSTKCIGRTWAAADKARKKLLGLPTYAPYHPVPRIDRACVRCGTLFTPCNSRSKRCSSRCARLDYQEDSARRRGLARRGGILPALVPCHMCGRSFKPFSVVARWCSKQCRSRGRDANRSRRWKIKRQRIYDRDGGTCQLCGYLIDLSIPYPNLMAYTVDHIIPVTAGGTDDDGNLQAAHMVCNSIKGGFIVRQPVGDASV